jgi:PIN domain nuclease of toxin-antitoxin system
MILLDTHTWLWWLHSPDQLSDRARTALTIGENQDALLVSSISVWEIASTQIPGDFHKDPADRMIIAIARRYDIDLITCDHKILNYPHVKTIW